MYKVGPVFAFKVMDMASPLTFLSELPFYNPPLLFCSTLKPSSPDFKGANITAGRESDLHLISISLRWSSGDFKV